MTFTINGEQLLYRRLVTIDGSMVSTQTGIPLGLNINLPGVKVGGADVRLATLGNTPIAREIECTNVPNADDVMIWYPFNTTGGTDSQFYIYWGNVALAEPAANSIYGSQAVWDANYKAVHHMNGLVDSTSNGHTLTTYGSPSIANTSYGKGYDLDGSTQYFSMADSADWDFGTGNLTFETYLDIDAVQPMEMLGFRYISTNKAPLFRIDNSGGGYKLMNYIHNLGTVQYGDTTITTGYKHCAEVRSGNDWMVYLNGAADSATWVTANVNIVSTTADIGRYNGGGFLINGRYCELRISNVNRGSSYLATSYNALRNPSASGTLPLYKSFGIIEPMVAAIGGTVTTIGDYRIHTFTSSGTFTVNKSMNVDVLVVAGGGAGSAGANGGAGGGAGGYRTNVAYPVTSGPAITVTVGAGGIGSTSTGTNGYNSVFGTIISIGGGGGTVASNGSSGGSGSGAPASGQSYTHGSGTSGQGNNGGNNNTTSPYPGGGGGGAGAAGGNGYGSTGGVGGTGLASSITGSSVYYAGGGGCGGTFQGASPSSGGNGGGGAGAGPTGNATAGTPNTGGGGGGAGNTSGSSGNGGSGIVIVRYLSSYDVTATSMIVTPRETPCRTGICIVDVSVTWTNNNPTSTSSFVPSITASSGTVSTYSSQNLDAGASVTLPFTVSSMTVGSCSICPNPN